jgi:hypothetical protein
MMGDIDVLVEDKGAERVQDFLIRSGYITLSRNENPDYSPEYRAQHLPRLLNPESPAALEIHFRVERGQAGRVLPTALAWECQRAVIFEGLKTLVLSPTVRLLHNTVHALVSQREFIRSSISLLQLAEFAALVCRYGSEIDWLEWFERGAGQGLDREFVTYLTLGERLMGVPWPGGVPKSALAEIHVRRILLTGKYSCRPVILPEKGYDSFRRCLVGLATRLFYGVNKYFWGWQNDCYVEGNKWATARYLLMKISSSLVGRLPGRVK